MKTYIHLSNGASFEGKITTKPLNGEIKGEVVFFTGMTGYQEVLTDPSYKDQIIVFTYPLVGNYGINEYDFESKKPHVAGVIVYEGNMSHSHYQADYSLKDYLDKWDIPLLSGIDTRALVKNIRKEGSMEAAISKERFYDTTLLIQKPNNVVQEVSSQNIQSFGKGATHIVLLDFGFKKSILDSLLLHKCRVTVVPFNTTLEKVKSLNPDGVVLSNGPGDPKQLDRLLDNIKAILSAYPAMAICLGHQLTALAFGGNTKKMLYGHRGANQPVVDLLDKSVYMSSQNHSYEVDETSLKNTSLRVRFRNVNDGTVEGLIHDTLPILTTQYHPEANPGPAESGKLFEEFLRMVNEHCGSVKAYA
ncbi:carbamoyl phosphate synthase small subunit [Peribacillus cavernae]|uniref:Carbamoyl phosphate synthase small chain n=1 Tax=Peribacillus cavernae TaxID=1674310 RepID=A0A3S0U3D1_9BACI|nr:carbamoyl phosphate synthase small subunit [Peribacillus cavernae]MDQ0217543.1 carbamoyl-phosphate synthase small subunit [Peribacillus cavernae]RUQ30021.1 carbamoyl phosphate synthase small subunit [Peribacillus cavernae]